MAEMTTMRIADILRVPELQARPGLDLHHVADILEQRKGKARGKGKEKIPRPKCIRIDDPEDTEHHGKVYAFDGHHTIEADLGLGKTKIPVAIIRGTWQDARDLAASANAGHKALKRSGETKRRAIRMMLEDHPDWTDPKIAKHTQTSPGLVADVRPEVPVAAEAKTRVGQDGKVRRATQNRATTPEVESNGTPDVDPAAVKDYFRGDDKTEEHAYADLLKSIVSLATKVSQAVNDAEPGAAIRQYLLDCGFVYPRDKIIGDRHYGWQCVGLRGVYRVIKLAGMPGNKNKRQVQAAYDAANRGEE